MINCNMLKYSIVVLDEVFSTNGYALENMPFLEDGTVIFALNQTSGRGRYNRKWISDNSGNIYMSLVIKPTNLNNYPITNLTQYLSVIICEFLQSEFSLNPQIKWPNDILINGAKISGILAESSYKNNKIEGIALGLGLNVNMTEETIHQIDQKATSLHVLLNKKFDSELLLRKLMDKFYQNYEEFVRYGFKSIKETYIKKCGFLGKKIIIKENESQKKYIAKAIDDEGLLIAIDEFNNECKIITGDVLC